jgi:hypothetical protein
MRGASFKPSVESLETRLALSGGVAWPTYGPQVAPSPVPVPGAPKVISLPLTSSTITIQGNLSGNTGPQATVQTTAAPGLLSGQYTASLLATYNAEAKARAALLPSAGTGGSTWNPNTPGTWNSLYGGVISIEVEWDPALLEL